MKASRHSDSKEIDVLKKTCVQAGLVAAAAATVLLGSGSAAQANGWGGCGGGCGGGDSHHSSSWNHHKNHNRNHNRINIRIRVRNNNFNNNSHRFRHEHQQHERERVRAPECEHFSPRQQCCDRKDECKKHDEPKKVYIYGPSTGSTLPEVPPEVVPGL
jgi:hypothetical protein